MRAMSNKLRLKGYQYRKIEEPYHIDDFSEPEEIQVDEVFRAQDDVIVECSVQYRCAITGYVYHAEAISENEFFEVTDWNWNEHYAEVQFSATVETKTLVRLSEERLEPDEAPVDEVPGNRLLGREWTIRSNLSKLLKQGSAMNSSQVAVGSSHLQFFHCSVSSLTPGKVGFQRSDARFQGQPLVRTP